jgi:Divergent InlB B-repeat domain
VKHVAVAGTVAAAAVLITAVSAASGGVRLHVFAQNGTVVVHGTRLRCDSSCSLAAARGSLVILEATPKRFFSFSHWGGACHGTATACALSMTSSKSARAVFTRNRGEVLVTVGGAGSVGVSSRSSAGCGTASGSCDISWPDGTAIELTAVPDAGGAFGGWGGACAATSGLMCRIAVNEFAQVTASFATTPTGSGDEQQLSVDTQDAPISASLPGFTCPQKSTCTALAATGTLVKLHVDPLGPPTQSPWRGACLGYGLTCALVVDGPSHVTAPDLAPEAPAEGFGLHIVVGGEGVVTDGEKIKNCTMTKTAHCSGFYTRAVRLRATPARGNVFGGWVSQTHVCTRKRASCIVDLGSSGTTIVAVFKPKQ